MTHFTTSAEDLLDSYPSVREGLEGHDLRVVVDDERCLYDAPLVVLVLGLAQVDPPAQVNNVIYEFVYQHPTEDVLFLRFANGYSITAQQINEYVETWLQTHGASRSQPLEGPEFQVRRIAKYKKESALKDAREVIRNISNEITNYEQNAAQYRMRLSSKQREIDAIIQTCGDGDVERMVEQYQMLCDHPMVASVAVNEAEGSSSLVITTTDDLRITRPDTEESRWLGQFRITVSIGGSRLDIKLKNLSTKRGGRDHPHVSNENPCFGSHQDDLYEMLANDQYYLLFDTLIQYLSTLNIFDEWGRYGAYWFDVEDERPLVAA